MSSLGRWALVKGDKTLNIVVSEGEPELNGADFAVELISGSEAEATYSFPPWWGEVAVEPPPEPPSEPSPDPVDPPPGADIP